MRTDLVLIFFALFHFIFMLYILIQIINKINPIFLYLETLFFISFCSVVGT